MYTKLYVTIILVPNNYYCVLYLAFEVVAGSQEEAEGWVRDIAQQMSTKRLTASRRHMLTGRPMSLWQLQGGRVVGARYAVRDTVDISGGILDIQDLASPSPSSSSSPNTGDTSSSITDLSLDTTHTPTSTPTPTSVRNRYSTGSINNNYISSSSNRYPTPFTTATSSAIGSLNTVGNNNSCDGERGVSGMRPRSLPVGAGLGQRQRQRHGVAPMTHVAGEIAGELRDTRK